MVAPEANGACYLQYLMTAMLTGAVHVACATAVFALFAWDSAMTVCGWEGRERHLIDTCEAGL